MIQAKKNKFLIKIFFYLTRWYLGKYFYRFWYGTEFKDLSFDEPLPVVGVLNHGSWWDALVAWYIIQVSFPFESFILLDEQKARKYRFLAKMGFFSINRLSKISGFKAFLKQSKKLLEKSNRAVWICPQGKIVSNDSRPIRFYPGAATLVRSLKRCWVLPMAMDYKFGENLKPEAFVYTGTPIKFEMHHNGDVEKTNQLLEKKVTQLMNDLKEKASHNPSDSFQLLLGKKRWLEKAYELFSSK